MRLFRRLNRAKNTGIRASWTDEPTRREHDPVSFLDWFDSAHSVDEAIRRAEIDWRVRFASEPEYRSLRKGLALEIGFGAGRLLAQAAKDFERVIGIDIHRSFAASRRFLASQGVTAAATLLHRDEIGSVAPQSVDLVYSFIVFQHFDGLAEVDFYLSEIDRILRPDGYAHLYIGKNLQRGVAVVPEVHYELRARTLLIEPQAMVELLEARFRVIRLRERLPKDPFTGAGESGQFAVVFRPR